MDTLTYEQIRSVASGESVDPSRRVLKIGGRRYLLTPEQFDDLEAVLARAEEIKSPEGTDDWNDVERYFELSAYSLNP